MKTVKSDLFCLFGKLLRTENKVYEKANLAQIKIPDKFKNLNCPKLGSISHNIEHVFNYWGYENLNLALIKIPEITITIDPRDIVSEL